MHSFRSFLTMFSLLLFPSLVVVHCQPQYQNEYDSSTTSTTTTTTSGAAPSAPGGVTFQEATHRLYFVSSTDEINYDAVGIPSSQYEDVPAYVLTNNLNVSVKAIARGATVTDISVNGTNYLWENIEGATYYGPETNNFPLKRGLIVHGGIRYSAVTSEHGLYYDQDWTVEVDDCSEDSMTIYISIIDNIENRHKTSNYKPPMGTTDPNVTGLSEGQFESVTSNGPTNLKYTLAITLRKDEDFVRLNMSIENLNLVKQQDAEAWLPMTYPITNDSVVLSKQSMRWRRDNWCLDDITPNMITVDEYDWLYRPLDWPMGCILYDFPKLEGRFHGVTTNEGRGIVYYIPAESSPHYTKQWSWGQSQWGRGNPGRPASNYYEPWSSGTNFAFFQTRAFEPQTRVSWEIAILPIQQGLDPLTKNRQQLLNVVDQHIDERMDQLLDIQDVQTVSIDDVEDEISDTIIFDPNNVDGNDDEDDPSSSSSVDATTANGFGLRIVLRAISFLLIFLL